MIRSLQNIDIDQVAEIWLHTNIEAHDFIPKQYWCGNYDAVKKMLLQAEIYVQENEKCGEIQGFIGLNGNHIEGLFVSGKAQSCGIGKQLLNYAKKIKNELSLCVYEKNVRALKFYQRENFMICSEDTDETTGEKEYAMIWKKDGEK